MKAPIKPTPASFFAPKVQTPMHIQTLTPNTPKGRRRIRKALGLTVEQASTINTDLASKAQDVATSKERVHNAPSKGKK